MTAEELKERAIHSLRGGMTPSIIALHRDGILKMNLSIIRTTTALGAAAGVLLCILSATVEFLRPGILLHFIFLLMMATINLRATEENVDYKKSLIIMYFGTGFCYLCAMFNSLLLHPDSTAAYMCIALAVLPLLPTDMYWRSVLPGIVAWGLYVLLEIFCGMPQIRVLNIVDTLIALAIGLNIARHNTKSRVSELTARDRIVDQRDTDLLTGILNRRAGEQRIRTVIDRGSENCAMMMVDIDDFKHFNDTYGHGYGDQVLIMVAHILQSGFRSSDIVCRLGGDEFMILMIGSAGTDAVERKANEILTTLANTAPPGDKKEEAAMVSISIGIVQSPRYGTEFSELYRKADNALYNAKRAGKNCFYRFGSEQEAEINEQQKTRHTPPQTQEGA